VNRRAWQFFMEYAGYATPPGRAVCAASLARSEEQAKAVELAFEWVTDECPDLSWMDEAGAAKEHDVLGCVARGPGGEHLASLWGIVDAGAIYRRVIEAELAAEVLQDSVTPLAARS
jgi:hypothetical protein